MVENLTLADARKRFLNYLKILKDKKGDTITLPVPKGEIALLLGTAPETFSRLLKKLSNDKIIEVKGRDIKILKELEE
jgi:CRP/FNR family transcriptional regulator